MNPPQSTFTMDGVWNQKYIFLCMINKSKFKLHSVKYSVSSFCLQGPSGSWSLWVRILVRYGVLDATLCDKVGHCLAAGRWFSPGTPISTTNKTHRHDIAEILLKVELNTINQTYTRWRQLNHKDPLFRRSIEAFVCDWICQIGIIAGCV